MIVIPTVVVVSATIGISRIEPAIIRSAPTLELISIVILIVISTGCSGRRRDTWLGGNWLGRLWLLFLLFCLTFVLVSLVCQHTQLLHEIVEHSLVCRPVDIFLL